MITVYGISNCDTVKKARRWLDQHGVAYMFHDYRRAGIDRQRLLAWCEVLSWEHLLNRRGTTWRGLSAAERDALDRDKAVQLMCEYPALIKRPVLEQGTTLLLGFEPDIYRRHLAS